MRAGRAIAAALLAACGGKGADTGGGGTDACGTVALDAAHNYSYAGALDAPSFTTVSGADVEICWDAVTTDIQCHDVDPATDVDNVALVRFGSLTEEEVEEALAENSLQQADVSGYVAVENTEDATCARLSDMSFFGTPVDVPTEYTEDGGTYMLLLTRGTEPGVGALMLAFLHPDPASTTDRVDVPEGCGVLDFQATLGEPIALCGEGPWTLDWSALETDAHGASLDGVVIDTAMLGFYEGMTPADLEARFLDLELIATRTWTATLDGEDSVDLGALVDEAGEPFAGFDGDGTWIFALRCSRCANPAPVYLAVLEVEG